MKSQTKAMEIIRKKQEKAEAARRKQVEAERKGEKVEFEDIGGAKEPRTPSTIKPGKVEKVNLSHFKLKTVLGRGGYGKVGKTFCSVQKDQSLPNCRFSWQKGSLTRRCVPSRRSARGTF